MLDVQPVLVGHDDPHEARDHAAGLVARDEVPAVDVIGVRFDGMPAAGKHAWRVDAAELFAEHQVPSFEIVFEIGGAWNDFVEGEVHGFHSTPLWC
ncbi:hypothetical protein D9M68_987060 [compost metagenome]